jgi:hypothetical protein
VILLFAFVCLSIACWSFFYSFLFFFFSLVLLYVGVVNALIKGEIEDHVWFEDRCMVTSWSDNVVWTDSWLSIAGVGCGLTGVGVGEEQARKV